MQLTDDQKKAVERWAKEGCGLSAIQKRLAGEFNLSLKYIDVRILLIDLGLDLKDAKKDAAPSKTATPPPLPGDEPTEFEPMPAPGRGGVAVSVDRIMRPGALVSGTVTFSDGMKATWALDQMGRLALGAERKDYRPSAEDVQTFQQAVSRELQKAGYA